MSPPTRRSRCNSSSARPRSTRTVLAIEVVSAAELAREATLTDPLRALTDAVFGALDAGLSADEVVTAVERELY